MPVLFLQEITREHDVPVAEAGSSDIPSVKGMKLPCGTVCETLLLQAFELYRFWMLEHVFFQEGTPKEDVSPGEASYLVFASKGRL